MKEGSMSCINNGLGIYIYNYVIFSLKKGLPLPPCIDHDFETYNNKHCNHLNLDYDNDYDPFEMKRWWTCQVCSECDKCIEPGMIPSPYPIMSKAGFLLPTLLITIFIPPKNNLPHPSG